MRVLRSGMADISSLRVGNPYDVFRYLSESLMDSIPAGCAAHLIECHVHLIGTNQILRRLDDAPVVFKYRVAILEQKPWHLLNVGVQTDAEKTFVAFLNGAEFLKESHRRGRKEFF